MEKQEYEEAFIWMAKPEGELKAIEKYLEGKGRITARTPYTHDFFGQTTLIEIFGYLDTRVITANEFYSYLSYKLDYES